MLLTRDTTIEIDIRLFVTLIRFDDIYRVHFKVNTRLNIGNDICVSLLC